MSQKTLKKLKYDGSDVIVEAAYRDGNGAVIANTYVTTSALSTALTSYQPTLTAGTGISISSNTISVAPATASALGGVKIGTGINVDANGVISSATTWSQLSEKPFKSFVSATNAMSNSSATSATDDFKLTGDYVLSINPSKWLTISTADSTYLQTSTYNTNRETDTGRITTLENAGYITNTVSNLTNYYTKSQVYTKTEIGSLIDGLKQFTYEIASVLPTASADTMYKIYLIPSSTSASQNVKDEFITIDNGAEAETRYTWEQIGTTTVDLTGYARFFTTGDNPLPATSNAYIQNGDVVITYNRGTNGMFALQDSGYKILKTSDLANADNPMFLLRDIGLTTLGICDLRYVHGTPTVTGDGLTASVSSGALTLASKFSVTDVTLDY